MKQVFSAHNLSDIYIVKTMLESEGISCVLSNEHLVKAQSTPEGTPSLWIPDDSRFEAAASIVSRFINSKGSPDHQGSPWKCIKCGELHEAQFTSCWRCGTDRP